MSEMVERSSIALRNTWKEKPEVRVRAVIQSLRQPTQTMLNEGAAAMTVWYSESIDVLLTKAWQAMIDEALR